MLPSVWPQRNQRPHPAAVLPLLEAVAGRESAGSGKEAANAKRYGWLVPAKSNEPCTARDRPPHCWAMASAMPG